MSIYTYKKTAVPAVLSTAVISPDPVNGGEIPCSSVCYSAPPFSTAMVILLPSLTAEISPLKQVA